ncbi:histidine phosphatase family protein [Agrobacterium rosae]|uniref:Histidine phosphatase family protein n=1 Tax=Agrobacterium rosae TaxID=1972867 RepID=A0AAW9FQC9_9HYPH|nr:histidine phosphatase family protein [Agrobacterium rosae]MDX8305713.1 histidine phosphatase family protein [Agrobacterium rosae]
MAILKDLLVVTHSEAVHHVENKVGGWHDSELTARGVRDAEATAERLAVLVGQREVEIYSSDLRRASQTAAVIAQRFGVHVAETDDLREISYGVAGGQPQDWLDARYIAAPDDNRLDHHCGIEGAETRREIAARVFTRVNAIVDRPCATQIMVTHGFTLSFVIAAWMKIPIDAAGFLSFPAKSGSITHLRQDDFFRSRAMIRLADTSHLDSEQSQIS